MILEELREKAKIAYEGTSFSPEKIAESLIKGYSEELEEVLDGQGILIVGVGNILLRIFTMPS